MKGLSIDFPSHMIESIIDSIKTLSHVISSSFLQLSRASSHTCTSLFLPLLSSMSWVPLVRSLFGGVQHSLLQSSHMRSLQMLPLPLNLLPFLPFLPHLGQLSPLLTSWSSFSTCVLILVIVLTIYPMRCVK